MSDRLVQVNIRLAESSADRLKQLAVSSGLKLGPFVERMIAAYSADSNLLQNDSSSVQWQAVVEELREIVASQEGRLSRIELAIQSGLGGRDAKVRVTVQAVENEPVEAEDDGSSHPANHSLPTAKEFNQDKDQFRAEAVKLYRQGIIGSPDILKILNERGFRNSKGNEYYRNDVRQALKDAELRE